MGYVRDNSFRIGSEFEVMESERNVTSGTFYRNPKFEGWVNSNDVLAMCLERQNFVADKVGGEVQLTFFHCIGNMIV